jgi:hypothetical protein
VRPIDAQAGRYLIFSVIGAGLVIVSLWEIARALKAGRLRLRVSAITRENQPRLFWFDIAVCGITAILGLLFACYFIAALMRHS